MHIFSHWKLPFECVFLSIRMWNIYGYSHSAGWIKLYIPLVWGAGLPNQYPPEVFYWSRTDSGMIEA